MKIIVIGGAGYIGSHIVHDLVEQAHEVTVFDNLSSGFRENLPNNVHFILGDILNSIDLKDVFAENFDFVMHFAALKAAGESMTNPGKYAENNISGSINILNAMVNAKIQNIIFSSSAAVYGFPEYLPVDENHPMKPINFYGYTKLAIEEILGWYSDLGKIKFAALRYFNAAGYDVHGRITRLENNPANLLPIVMEVATGKREEMQVFGDDYNTKDGTGVRDYIHVSDLSVAHIKAMKYMQETGKNITINLATGDGYSVQDIMNLAEKITGKKINHEIVPRRHGDPAELVAKSQIANELLDWRPRYSSLERILETMWSVYEQN